MQSPSRVYASWGATYSVCGELESSGEHAHERVMLRALIKEVMGEHRNLLVTPVVLGGFGRFQERCTSELDVFDIW